MQATFVINPALGAGYYYIFYEKPGAPHDLAFLGVCIATLGFVYNFGAGRVYRRSHVFMEQLLIRMKELDISAGLKVYEALQLTAPRSYARYWGRPHIWRKGGWREWRKS